MVSVIRAATLADAPFLSWAMLTAYRSHTDTCVPEVYLGVRKGEAMRFLEALTQTEIVHHGHFSAFSILEVDCVPVAAMSGYFEAEMPFPALLEGIDVVSKSFGMSAEEITDGTTRVAPAAYCNAEHAPRAWILEWVATKPEFRRRGYIEQLIEHTLERGRARGAVTAEVGVLIGNDSAQKAYEKAGFTVVQEVRHPEFEAAFHAPGTRLLHRSI